jgi:hypothetical protein
MNAPSFVQKAGRETSKIAPAHERHALPRIPETDFVVAGGQQLAVG